MISAIEAKNLTKTFTYTTPKGKKVINAVSDITFSIRKGESVGFIGPNGAGKSTTIKMLTGILYPTSGNIRVAGISPTENQEALSYKIGCVFGQRSQLLFNLPPKDSLELFGKLYGIYGQELQLRIAELVKLMGMEEFINQPVRKLSLGQRMRAEIACSLIHDPEIIFLDEPTLGLDVVAKRQLRKVLTSLNKKKRTTLFLTSHDMGDIEALCERTIIVNHGRIILDEKTEELNKLHARTKVAVIDFEDETHCQPIFGTKVLEEKPKRIKLEVDLTRTTINRVLQELMDLYVISDIDVDKPSLETIISTIYEEKDSGNK